MSQEKYDSVIKNGYQFEMSLYINEGWDLFKKGLPNFIGFGILFIIIALITSVMWTSISIGISFEYSYWMSLVYEFISEILQGAVFAGIFVFCRNLLNNREEFGQFFHGFKRFQDIALCTIIILCIFLPFKLFFSASSYSLYNDFGDIQDLLNTTSLLGSSSLIVSIISLVVYTMYSFAIPLIVDDEVSFWEAMEISRKVILPKFFNFLGMYIVIGILVLIGSVFTCGLGFVAAIPYIYCVIFSAYDHILQPSKSSLEDEINEFGMIEKDINSESGEF